MSIDPEEIEDYSTRAARRAAGLTYEENIKVIDRTPNVVIESPNIRLWAGFVLFALSLLSGLAALVLGVFPEIEIGNAIVSRSIELANQIVSFLTGAFGLAVVLPNVPNKPGATS